jgi:hypothetical protein
MAQKTKAQILAEIASLLADNTTGDISASDVRTVVNDITDSYEDIIATGTTSQYLRGDKTWQNLPLLELNGTLTAAQINSSYTTPITLLGAAGANKYYVIEYGSFHYKAGTTGFTTIGYPELAYNTTNEAIWSIITPTILNSTTSKIYINGWGALFTAEFPTTIINDSIIFRTPSSISGGDGTINFSIRYRIVTTS